MPLVTTKEMFEKSMKEGFAIGAFNVNNMEIIQGITEAAKEMNAPVILQVSAGARKYAKHGYLMALIKAAVEDTDLPIAVHLDHGADFEICKACFFAQRAPELNIFAVSDIGIAMAVDFARFFRIINYILVAEKLCGMACKRMDF